MTRVALALAVLALVVGCRRTSCEELTPVPNAGRYVGGGSLGSERLRGVAVEASATQVTLTFTSPDGARIKALYRVLKKRRVRGPVE